MTEPRRYRAGQTVEDLCRACKEDRLHTVIVADGDGRPLRVACDFCGSEHNYRGGGSSPAAGSSSGSGTSGVLRGGPSSSSSSSSSATPPPTLRREPPPADPFPLVSDRERSLPAVSVDSSSSSTNPVDLELLLRRVIREESGLTMATPAAKWRGGELVLRPGKADLQEKSWPIETFFHKIVMLRNRLRTLEQQVNATELPEDTKVRLQAYITGCYGSLTSFNVLFAEEGDQFKGSGGGE